MNPDDDARVGLSPSDRSATESSSAQRSGLHRDTSAAAETAGSSIGRAAADSSRPVRSAVAGARLGSAQAPAVPARDIEAGWVIETVISPFQCLYQDALAFHTQSRLARSESDASRLARASLLLYVSSAEALVHQAAEELGGPELRRLLADPARPLPLFEIWRLLPGIVASNGAPPRPLDPQAPPWPQFAELVSLRTSWAYPGAAASRRAYYRSHRRDGEYEPLEPHQLPADLARSAPPIHLAYPLTGMPRDPYALRPRHLDTARGVLDASIEALDTCMGGALTRGQRHRREPVRVVHPLSS